MNVIIVDDVMFGNATISAHKLKNNKSILDYSGQQKRTLKGRKTINRKGNQKTHICASLHPIRFVLSRLFFNLCFLLDNFTPENCL